MFVCIFRNHLKLKPFLSILFDYWRKIAISNNLYTTYIYYSEHLFSLFSPPVLQKSLNAKCNTVNFLKSVLYSYEIVIFNCNFSYFMLALLIGYYIQVVGRYYNKSSNDVDFNPFYQNYFDNTLVTYSRSIVSNSMQNCQKFTLFTEQLYFTKYMYVSIQVD